MVKRELGATGLHVSILSVGGAAFGSRTSRRDAREVVERALELGVNFFDTAPLYGQGESERILGDALGALRKDVVLSTKIGLQPNLGLRLLAYAKPAVRTVLKLLPAGRRKAMQSSARQVMSANREFKFDPQSIEQSVEASLKRLRTDRIDLLMPHLTPPPEVFDQVVDQMLRLRQKGKIRAFGGCCHSAADIDRWLSVSGQGLAALQIAINLEELSAIESGVEQVRNAGVGIIARQPFARGRLLPPSASEEAGHVGFVGQQYDRRFEAIAKELGLSVPQLALRYVTQVPGVSAVLAGMSSVRNLTRNVEAVHLPELSPAQIRAVRRVALSETAQAADSGLLAG